MHQAAKALYLKGEKISDIAITLGLSRTTVYGYKNRDKKNGIDWDDLRYLHATDQKDAQRNEQDFIALLIFQFERALDELNTAEPHDQIETLNKYVNTYYKLKRQQTDPKVSKAEVAKNVIEEISSIAIKHNATAVIQFLSDHADEVVSTIIK